MNTLKIPILALIQREREHLLIVSESNSSSPLKYSDTPIKESINIMAFKKTAKTLIEKKKSRSADNISDIKTNYHVVRVVQTS
jgi:hypothetical protein